MLAINHLSKLTIIICLLLISVIAKAQLHGIDTNWYSSPIEMPKHNTTWNASGAVANNMVVHNGKVLIFYTEDNGIQSKHYITGSNDNGYNWNQPASTPFIPSTKTGGNSTISTDIDSSGTIHAIWSSQTHKGVFYVSANISTLNWSDTIRIGSTNKTKIGFCQVSVDRKNRIHAYWNEGSPGGMDTAEVFYTHSINGSNTWIQPIQLSEGEARHSAFPSGDFCGTSGDSIAIAWRDSISDGSNVQNWDVKMVTSTDAGNTWSAPFTVSGGNGMQSDPSVIVDKNNIIHICYHYYPENGGILNSQVYYAYSTNMGATWNPQTFTKISPDNIQSHLVKGAYDYNNDVVWYFYKDQRDYISPFDKRADIMGLNISNGGNSISSLEFISDADSNEVGFHNFKVGNDGIVRSHFFIIPYENDSTTLYYTQRNPITTAISETFNLNQPLIVYPNPFTDKLYINKFKNIVLCRLYNNFGQLLWQGNDIEKHSFKHLPKGLYTLQIQRTNGIHYIKLIKN